MARRTHKIYREEEAKECIQRKLTILLSPGMSEFLELEAKRLSEREGKRIRPGTIVRALLTTYYEKRVAGLLVDPDD